MTHPSSAPAEIGMLCLGDSYTIGEGVQPGERWCDELARSLREHGVAVVSPTIVARTGWTTDELSEAIDAARPTGPFALVTLLIGVNDQYRGRAVSEFRRRFAQLLARAVAFADDHAERVLVLSIPDWGVTPFAAGRDRWAIAGEIDAFNKAVRDETAKTAAHFVDITPLSRSAEAKTQIVADGLHPSATMYAEWARLALPAALGAL